MVDFPFDLSKLDLSSMMGMARKVKEEMARVEDEMRRIAVESSVGGGMVTVTASGLGEVLAIRIDPALSAVNHQALEELVLAGVNQALKEAKDRREEALKRLTGGMNLPGFFA